jgi:hypothetical protein
LAPKDLSRKISIVTPKLFFLFSEGNVLCNRICEEATKDMTHGQNWNPMSLTVELQKRRRTAVRTMIEGLWAAAASTLFLLVMLRITFNDTISYLHSTVV